MPGGGGARFMGAIVRAKLRLCPVARASDPRLWEVRTRQRRAFHQRSIRRWRKKPRWKQAQGTNHPHPEAGRRPALRGLALARPW